MLNYTDDHSFIPHRTALPHEHGSIERISEITASLTYQWNHQFVFTGIVIVSKRVHIYKLDEQYIRNRLGWELLWV